MMDQASKLRSLAVGKEAEGARSAARPAPVSRGTDARVIAVTSGKGGVGKTTFAVNLAILLAEADKRVLIVDGDLGLANVDVMLGLDSGRHIGHLLLADCAPDEVAAVGPRGVRVISGGSGLRELAQATSVERRFLLDKLSAYYRHFDWILLDTSPGIGAEVLDFLRDADELLVVTTPEPTAIRDTYAALKMIVCEMPSADVRLVVNMVASAAQAEQTLTVLNAVASKFLNRRWDNWHYVERDPLVGNTVRDRKPLVCAYPRSPAAACLRRLARSLTQNGSYALGQTCCQEVSHAVA